MHFSEKDSAQDGSTVSTLDARDVALLKALHASSEILRHELESMGSSINQHVPIEIKENSNIDLVIKRLNSLSMDNGVSLDGEKKRHSKDQNWSQDVADSLKVYHLTYLSHSQHASGQIVKSILNVFVMPFEGMVEEGAHVPVLCIPSFNALTESCMFLYLIVVGMDKRFLKTNVWTQIIMCTCMHVFAQIRLTRTLTFFEFKTIVPLNMFSIDEINAILEQQKKTFQLLVINFV